MEVSLNDQQILAALPPSSLDAERSVLRQASLTAAGYAAMKENLLFQPA